MAAPIMGSFIVILLHHARASARAVNDNDPRAKRQSSRHVADLYLYVVAITIRPNRGEKYSIRGTLVIPLKRVIAFL
jgi:hypothetical protein